VSPTMHCCINLASQYFLIYALLWVFITVEDLTSWDLRKGHLQPPEEILEKTPPAFNASFRNGTLHFLLFEARSDWWPVLQTRRETLPL